MVGLWRPGARWFFTSTVAPMHPAPSFGAAQLRNGPTSALAYFHTGLSPSMGGRGSPHRRRSVYLQSRRAPRARPRPASRGLQTRSSRQFTSCARIQQPARTSMRAGRQCAHLVHQRAGMAQPEGAFQLASCTGCCWPSTRTCRGLVVTTSLCRSATANSMMSVR